MLFLNAVGDVYHNNDPNGEQRFNKSPVLMQKFIHVTPMTLMTMMISESRSPKRWRQGVTRRDGEGLARLNSARPCQAHVTFKNNNIYINASLY